MLVTNCWILPVPEFATPAENPVSTAVHVLGTGVFETGLVITLSVTATLETETGPLLVSVTVHTALWPARMTGVLVVFDKLTETTPLLTFTEADGLRVVISPPEPFKTRTLASLMYV
jgi:hypothetical protein